jgi:hypothetical protein
MGIKLAVAPEVQSRLVAMHKPAIQKHMTREPVAAHEEAAEKSHEGGHKCQPTSFLPPPIPRA